MRVAVAILAAGRGTRFGCDKTQVVLGGKPVWKWSYDTFEQSKLINRVFVVANDENITAFQAAGVDAIIGGETRQQSARNATLASGDVDILLLHDGARPFVSPEIIEAVVKAIGTSGAAAAAIPVTDTIKRISQGQVTTLDRSSLVAMQTPQGASVTLLKGAYKSTSEDFTDEMALLESVGVQPTIVAGSPQNFKITTHEDLMRAQAIVGYGEQRTGFGYDVHSFSSDPDRTLWLGGIAFPGHLALDGHSDADAVLHAAVDALLGAAALGDIGVHFPNTDERWRGEPSITFLMHAKDLLDQEGWSVVNLDMTVVAESPKVMKKSLEIRELIAQALATDVGRVSIKATTNEKMGFVGRGEGIAALATATIRKV